MKFDCLLGLKDNPFPTEQHCLTKLSRIHQPWRYSSNFFFPLVTRVKSAYVKEQLYLILC